MISVLSGFLCCPWKWISTRENIAFSYNVQTALSLTYSEGNKDIRAVETVWNATTCRPKHIKLDRVQNAKHTWVDRYFWSLRISSYYCKSWPHIVCLNKPNISDPGTLITNFKTVILKAAAWSLKKRKKKGAFNLWVFVCTFMHLEDAFIRRDLQCVDAYIFLNSCMFILLGIKSMILVLLLLFDFQKEKKRKKSEEFSQIHCKNAFKLHILCNFAI